MRWKWNQQKMSDKSYHALDDALFLETICTIL